MFHNPRMRVAAFAIASFLSATLLMACAHQSKPTPLPTPASAIRPLTGSWPTYQLDATHNAVLPKLSLHGEWLYKNDSKNNSGLAVVDNTLFFDDFAGRVIALDARSGKMRWRWKTDAVLMSTPIVAENRVYVGSGHNGPMSHVQRSFAYLSGTHAAQDEFWGRMEGDHVFAIDAARGTLLWSYRTMGEDMPSPTIAHGSLVFANGDAHAYGLDPVSGAAKWRQRLNGISTMASATPIGNDVLVSDCNFADETAHTYAFESRSGRSKWVTPNGNCDSSPTAGSGLVFLSGIEGNNQAFGFGGHAIVAAVDGATGRLKWRFRSADIGPYSAVSSNERAIAGTFANDAYFQALPSIDQIVAFDSTTGKIRWSFHSAGPVKMSVVVWSGEVFFGDVAGLFYTLDEKTGRLLKTRIFNEPFSTSPPVLAGGVVFIVNGTTVYAFHAR